MYSGSEGLTQGVCATIRLCLPGDYGSAVICPWFEMKHRDTNYLSVLSFFHCSAPVSAHAVQQLDEEERKFDSLCRAPRESMK